MNERIKKLIEQAKLNEPFDCGVLTKDQWLEKFADLVVDECCAILFFDMHEKTKSVHNYYGHAALELKRRFNEH